MHNSPWHSTHYGTSHDSTPHYGTTYCGTPDCSTACHGTSQHGTPYHRPIFTGCALSLYAGPARARRVIPAGGAHGARVPCAVWHLLWLLTGPAADGRVDAYAQPMDPPRRRCRRGVRSMALLLFTLSMALLTIALGPSPSLVPGALYDTIYNGTAHSGIAYNGTPHYGTAY